MRIPYRIDPCGAAAGSPAAGAPLVEVWPLFAKYRARLHLPEFQERYVHDDVDGIKDESWFETSAT
jgi:hypothetical protein